MTTREIFLAGIATHTTLLVRYWTSKVQDRRDVLIPVDIAPHPADISAQPRYWFVNQERQHPLALQSGQILSISPSAEEFDPAMLPRPRDGWVIPRDWPERRPAEDGPAPRQGEVESGSLERTDRPSAPRVAGDTIG